MTREMPMFLAPRSGLSTWLRSRKGRRTIQTAIVYFLLIAGAVVLMVPIAFMFSTSLKTKSEVFIFPPVWIPFPPRWSNYPEALFGPYNFPRAFWNTLQIVVPAVIGYIVSSTMVAYAFARLRFPFRDGLFVLVLSTLMLPVEVQLIPVFMIFKTLGWVNTFKPMQIWPFFGNPFYIFLMRQFFLSIPKDIEDAARVDGCGPLGLLLWIFIPMSRPAVIVVGLFGFMAWYNELLAPLIYLNSPNKYPVALMLASFAGDPFSGSSWHLLMAATIVVVLPCAIIYFLAQRYFVQGVVVTGIK